MCRYKPKDCPFRPCSTHYPDFKDADASSNSMSGPTLESKKPSEIDVTLAELKQTNSELDKHIESLNKNMDAIPQN